MKKFKNYVFAAMFAALVLMATMFIQVPTINGYVHIGDTLVYLAATFLPFPFSVLAAGVGAGLADLLSGYTIYLPFTFVIKGLMALCFSAKGEKILTKRNVFAIVLAGIINVFGYFLTEMILYRQGSLIATIVTSARTIPGNLVQSVVASVIFVVVALAFDKMNFKKTLEKIQ